MSKQLTEKKQHYLTWSYLHRFAINPDDDKSDSFIYMLGPWSTDAQKIKTASQCYREIDYQESTLTSQEIMKLTEIPFTLIINRFIGDKKLSTLDFRLLIRLIVFMHLRSISSEENLEFEKNDDFTNINFLIQKHYKILYSQHLLTYPRLSADQISNLDISKFVSRFRIGDAVDPKWKIELVEHKDAVFYTSDNPVLFFTYTTTSSPSAPLMILPISPSKLLIVYHTDYFELEPKIKIDNRTIDFINCQLFSRCNYVIYSNRSINHKKIEEMKKNRDQTPRYDKLNLKRLGINLQVDHYPKHGLSFLRPTRKVD